MNENNLKDLYAKPANSTAKIVLMLGALDAVNDKNYAISLFNGNVFNLGLVLLQIFQVKILGIFNAVHKFSAK